MISSEVPLFRVACFFSVARSGSASKRERDNQIYKQWQTHEAGSRITVVYGSFFLGGGLRRRKLKAAPQAPKKARNKGLLCSEAVLNGPKYWGTPRKSVGVLLPSCELRVARKTSDWFRLGLWASGPQGPTH